MKYSPIILLLFLLAMISCDSKKSNKAMDGEMQGPGENAFTLLFIHGNSSSSSTFDAQLQSDLSKKYYLSAMNLPGHGDAPPAEDIKVYSLPGYASAAEKYIADNNLTNVVLVGWSLGGHIALEMVAKENHPYKGIVIYGTPPLGIPPDMGAAFLPNEAVNIGFTPELDETMARSYAMSFFKPESTIDPAPFVKDILSTDGKARANLVPSMSSIGYADEVLAVKNLNVPIMVIHGAEEQLVNGAYLDSLDMPTLYSGKVTNIEDAGHAPHIEQSQKFNDLLSEFVDALE